jgi:hypothetical protein
MAEKKFLMSFPMEKVVMFHGFFVNVYQIPMRSIGLRVNECGEYMMI